ncbi:dihydrodipicolinate synthase family protein [Tautonia sociabilis]|uniref:Dihydrodipicolinate synthase family protein n=1 Tax=Tautonia sociabilis TaxID=2080755 RepID=A0A432MGS7_9BACT|nr:dihydrodipicolinate synthase family protein [Tautonia sociabilis]RUL86130.1 dihydrodipicolinate synthase family protein [Tautonia sociabilis]
MALPHLHGIVPPVASPIGPDEAIDVPALQRLVGLQLQAGVHGLWVMGTTARFDLVTERQARTAAEVVAAVAGSRVPLVLNVSDMGTKRTLERASRFDDLPYDYYAALPPWYQPFPRGELISYFSTLADHLSRPLIIYNAPWVCNQLTFDELLRLAEHPRILGVKDVWPGLFRTQDFSVPSRRERNFSYLHGSDLIGTSTALGADGFVPALGNAFPELCVALWDAARAGDDGRAFRLQTQLTRLARAMSFGPMLACLEAACRHRGLLDRMLPAPMSSLDPETSRKVVSAIEEVGFLPEPASEPVAGGLPG